MNFLSPEDYEDLAYEQGDAELLDYPGWCCTRSDDGLEFYIRADITVDTALAIMANEAGARPFGRCSIPSKTRLRATRW